MAELHPRSRRKIEAFDITDQIVSEPLEGSFAWLGCPHTTAALLLCEADPEMLADLERVAAEVFAPYEPFRHHKNNNPNAAAHLLSSLLGTQLVVPIAERRLQLGTYQRLVLLELDGPRERTVQIRTW